MSWSEFGASDVVGSALGAFGTSLENFANVLMQSSKSMANNAITAAERGELMRAAWQQLDNTTASAYSALGELNTSSLNAQIVARVEAAKFELARSVVLLENAAQTATLSKNFDIFAKTLGTLYATAEVLWTIKNPDASAYDFGDKATGLIFGFMGGSIAIMLGMSMAPAIVTGLTAGAIGREAWDWLAPQLGWSKEDSPLFWDTLFDSLGFKSNNIDSTVNSLFTSALNWVQPRRDPLVLDLDGNGITASGINANAPILFDQDGDGIRTATGWIAAGEALVVRDLNNNGLIDSGRELFGDNTLLTRGTRTGELAAHGFEALADLDVDAAGLADGKFDANDVAFASVKLWKDLNQDGVSQTGELFNLADLGVASINVSGVAGNIDLGGGNTQTHSGTYVRSDGSAGDSGTAQLAGNLVLTNNNFYREFTDDPAPTAAALALPNMRGSGMVRDLWAAMSLGTPQAVDLQNKLAIFAAGTTQAQQLASVDALIQSWGATILQTSLTLANPAASSGAITSIEQFAQNNPDIYAKITTLEHYSSNTILETWRCASGHMINDSMEHVVLINQESNALRKSARTVQTQFKPYLDAIGLPVDTAKTIAAYARGLGALTTSTFESKAPVHHRSRCARSGSSRRDFPGHPYRCDATGTQMAKKEIV